MLPGGSFLGEDSVTQERREDCWSTPKPIVYPKSLALFFLRKHHPGALELVKFVDSSVSTFLGWRT